MLLKHSMAGIKYLLHFTIQYHAFSSYSIIFKEQQVQVLSVGLIEQESGFLVGSSS